MKGYDQRKTASPHDDDWSDFCPRCGAHLEDPALPEVSDEDQESEWYQDGFCSLACFEEYEKDFSYDGLDKPRHERATDEQIKRAQEIYLEAEATMHSLWQDEVSMTIDDVFDYAPEGDFKWDDNEGGDWHIYNCGEKDCPIGWHKTCYVMDMGRKDGKRWIEIHDIDEDGNSDFCNGWEEGDDPYDILRDIAQEASYYFLGWAQYWAECVITGKDVKGEAHNLSVQGYLDAAEENLKYLKKRTV